MLALRPRGVDFVVIAKPHAASSSYHATADELRRLLSMVAVPGAQG
jgi:RNase P protein component